VGDSGFNDPGLGGSTRGGRVISGIGFGFPPVGWSGGGGAVFNETGFAGSTVRPGSGRGCSRGFATFRVRAPVCRGGLTVIFFSAANVPVEGTNGFGVAVIPIGICLSSLFFPGLGGKTDRVIVGFGG
jgi:hypothetical protein